MTAAVLSDHSLPWTEEEYLALGETDVRVELIDGGLILSPAPTPGHQAISSELYLTLRPAAKAAGLQVFEAINIRLRHGRIAIPDLVVMDRVDPATVVSDAATMRLICEIVSPSNPAMDRVLKMGLYAEAGIPWYLIVESESESVLLRLFRLEKDHYIEHAVGKPGNPLIVTEPVAVSLDPEELLHWW